MTDTAHTPTWEVSHDAVPEGFTQETIYDAETGKRIATVFEADAVALIASAPTLAADNAALVAALEALRTNVRAWLDTDAPIGWSWGDMADAVTAAEAALAQARAIASAPTLAADNAALVAACEAAIRYGDAIFRRASSGDVIIQSDGSGLAEGDDLDILYDDWITKALAALAQARQ